MPNLLQSLLRVLLFAAIILALGWSASHWETFEPQAIADWAASHRAAAPAAFMIARAFGAVAFVPGSVMAVAAGIVFGPVWGAVYNLIGSTVGAVAAFGVARFIAPNWLGHRLMRGPSLERLARAVETNGWRVVAFVRLVPLFPYNVLNYALGLTRIPLSHYTLASLVCMIPGDVAYVYLGFTSGELAAGGGVAVRRFLVAIGLLAALVLIPPLMRAYLAQPPAPRDNVDRGS